MTDEELNAKFARLHRKMDEILKRLEDTRFESGKDDYVFKRCSKCGKIRYTKVANRICFECVKNRVST